MKLPKKPVLTSLAALLFLTAPNWAAPLQEVVEAGTVALPAARSVVDRFIEVTNAASTIANTETRRVRGKMSMAAMGIEGTYEVLMAKPNIQKMTAEMGAMGTQQQGFDGEHGWQVHSMMGTQLLEGLQLLQLKARSAYDSATRPPALYESIETVGKEDFEGKECFKLKLVLEPLEGMDADETAKGRTSFDYYDVESGLLVGSVMTQATQMGEMEVTNVTSDYKKFGEELFATKTTQKAPWGEVVLTIESIEFDVVSEEELAVPAEITALIEE